MDGLIWIQSGYMDRSTEVDGMNANSPRAFCLGKETVSISALSSR